MCEPNPHHRLEQAEATLRHRLRGRASALRVVHQEGGVVLQGQAVSYHTKQLGQHIVISEFQLIVLANEIEVCPAPPAHDSHHGDAG